MTAAASAAHGAACQELVRQGLADHVYQYARHARSGSGDMYIPVCHCGLESRYHSPDMVPFDVLPDERKAYWEAVAAAVEEPWRERIQGFILDQSIVDATKKEDVLRRLDAVLVSLMEPRP